jgi:hypothetical protein
VRTIYAISKVGAQFAGDPGVFDLANDADGRWFLERVKGLLFAIERDANAIAKETRRGKGNLIVTTADVASALAMAGVLNYAPALQAQISLPEVDETGVTMVGTVGRFKVYIDPYLGTDGYVVGYKGANAYDAGMFYCPYVPLQMVRATSVDTFQPAIGFTAGTPQAGSGEVDAWNSMSMTIEKTSVTAKTRQLRADYSLELAQDLRAIHGLDAENELSIRNAFALYQRWWCRSSS